MHFHFRNVNDAFEGLVGGIHNNLYELNTAESRNGEVKYFPEPVMVTLSHPCERVLYNTERDCNPFFHMYEFLWMLAGRSDLAPLDFYNSRMKHFSDDGKILNGAYGYRWRNRFDYYRNDVFGYETSGGLSKGYTDQIEELIRHIGDQPNTRRAVLQMWNVEDDLLRIDGENMSRDVCCNTNCYFKVRTIDHGLDSSGDYLDMTVCNRSNDLVWGMLGSNVVHFSFLLEYMARRLKMNVGNMHTMTNNLHVYNWNWEPEKWLSYELIEEPPSTPIDCLESVVNFVDEWHVANSDLNLMLELGEPWKSSFFNNTAMHMFHAFRFHKMRNYDAAYKRMERVESLDWKKAGMSWLLKRESNWRTKNER